MLECVTNFSLDTTVESVRTLKVIVASTIKHIVIDRIASQKKAGIKSEGLESETGSNGGVEAETGFILVRCRIIIDHPIIILSVVIIVVVIKVTAEDERGTCCDVDKGFHSLAALEIVAIVQEHRNAMTGTNIHGVAQTDTKQVLCTVEENAVDEQAFKSEIGLLSSALRTAAQIKSVFIDHVIRDLLFLFFLSRNSQSGAQ